MSSAAQSGLEYTIPTVTEDDLRAFHLAHFPSSQPAPGPGAFETAAEPLEPDTDDGLGYYSDGVKRTLTDEQIALFRHSEIETLLREQRHRVEAGEDSEEISAGQPLHQPPNTEQTAHEADSKRRPNAANPRANPQSQKLSTKAQHISKTDPQGRTHRRLARELDHVAEEVTVELDY